PGIPPRPVAAAPQVARGGSASAGGRVGGGGARPAERGHRRGRRPRPGAGVEEALGAGGRAHATLSHEVPGAVAPAGRAVATLAGEAGAVTLRGGLRPARGGRPGGTAAAGP